MPTRTRRGQGQWALGYREPLNANEQLKRDDGLNVRQRILDRCAHQEKECLGGPLPDRSAPEAPVGGRDHLGVHRQQDGRWLVGLTANAGRLSGTALWEWARRDDERLLA